MQNYFNYFTEIESRFQARRGTALLLSTLDWALIETWREAGIPLDAVLRGIDDAFDKYDARLNRAKGRLRKVNGLAWCAQSVMTATEAMRDAAVGGHDAAAVADESGFEPTRISAWLQANAAVLQEASAGPAAREALHGIAGRLLALASDVSGAGGSSAVNTEDLEATLTALEGRLFAVLMLDASEETVLGLREQAARELAPYRGSMSAVQLKQVTDQFLHKRLLAQTGLPRLSLFYMDVQ